MDRDSKDQIVKIICYAIGCIIAYYVFMALLPYIVMALAVCGAGNLYLAYLKNKWRNRR